MPKKKLEEAIVEALAKPRPPVVKKIKKVTGRKKKK